MAVRRTEQLARPWRRAQTGPVTTAMDHGQSDQGRRADALLAATRSQIPGVGRLKIFLGAAPGVGKTFEMLQAAQARRREGVDVVVGIVETHGRAETMALVEGLETLPRIRIDYRGQIVEEFDLDALLARRPALALIDELAHTNALGSRHPKRYLDVEELLAAGIDVYTTLNIQHVESLNDVVARITRIRVRETVPDRIIDRAEIELIDLTPDDLIRRLRDGKVYVAKHAERALRHYFSPGNLTALRELALRRTAQRVDAQLLTHMRSHAIEGPWAAGERVIVCVCEDTRAAGLVRHAKRLADYLHAPLTALFVETRRSLEYSDAERDRLAQTMRLVQTLGGEVATIPAASRRVAEDVLAFARARNVTQIVVGKSNRSVLFELLNGSVVHDLVRHSGNIGIHVVAGDESESGLASARTNADGARSRTGAAQWLWSCFAVAAALGFAEVTRPLIGLESVDLVFLTAVVVIAVRFGLWASLLAVILSSLSYNYFFLPPLYTFTIADPTNVAALFFFALVAVLVSNLAARARAQTLAAQMRARTTEALYTFSRKLASCVTIDDVLWATVYQIASMLKVRVVLLLEQGGPLSVHAGYPPEDMLDDADLAAARWAFDNGKAAGRGADTLPGARRFFQPLRTGRGAIGVVGLDRDGSGPLLTPDQARLFDALVDQSALAIERVRLVEDLDRAKLAAETDRLRQALLTSISHDLKTPLAAILGAGTSLRDLGEGLTQHDKVEFVGTIIEESERLNRFIANLLDMTRLESGAVAPRLEAQDVGEIVGAALGRASGILAAHHVEVDIEPGLPMPRLDAVLFEQVLFNLLDNAAKYSAAGAFVRIVCRRAGANVEISVSDKGIGIPHGDTERIFDKFYRARQSDSVRAGTGLGLAISRGFIEAMGGTITAGNRPDGKGAIFTLTVQAADTATFREVS